MGYLDYAGLQYLWGKLKEKFAPKSHSHDDRYYTESEVNTLLASKVHEETITDARDLNTVKTTGIYHLKTTNFTNGPGITNHGTLIVDYTVGTPYQIYIPDSKNQAFRRNHNNSSSVWNAWSELKLTDTNTWRGIQDNLTSDSTSDSLSAAQGKVLKGLVDGKLGKNENAVSATTSKSIQLLSSTRPTNMNFNLAGTDYLGKVTYQIASSSTTTGKPPHDAGVLNFSWDNGGWGAQVAVENDNSPRMYVRGASPNNGASKWDANWKTVAFTDDKPATAGTADVANSVDWSKVQNKPSSYPPASHSHAYLPISGGTMSGALTFANNTWNPVGDDVQIGDHNTSGSFYVQGLNGPTNIKLKKKGDTSAGSGDSATITYDGGNLVIDKTIQANLSGNASTATKAVSADKATSAATADKAAKLATARTVSGGTDITLSFNYDGSGNSNANIEFYNRNHTVQNTNNYPFHRFAKLDASKEAWSDKSMTFLINQDYSGGGYGICRLVYRSNADSSNASVAAEWLVRKGLSADSVQVAIKTDKTNGAYCDAFYKSGGTYNGCSIRALASGGRASQSRTWTLIGSMEASGTTTSDKKNSVECWKTIAEAGTALHNQAYSSTASAVDSGYVNSAGTSNSCTGNAATATGVKDYNEANRTIKIGYAGAGLTTSNLSYIAGYTNNGTQIKDVSKTVLQDWIDLNGMINKLSEGTSDPQDNDYYISQYSGGGTTTTTYHRRPIKALWNYIKGKADGVYLKLTGGTISGRITHNGGGSWISSRDQVAVFGTKSNKDSFNPVVGQKTPKGAWAMGNLGEDERLCFGYTTDANYNAGSNNAVQVWLPAQAGTIITSATIGDQSVTAATKASGVVDYNNANNTIKIGWSGTDLDANTLAYIAGYTSDMKIHTASKAGVRSWIGLGTAAYKNEKTATGVTSTGWTNNATDDAIVPTMSFMAYWNGAYSDASSNLQYCDRGRFGTIITKGSGDYLPIGGGTLTGDLKFSDIGDTATSHKISWAGSTDGADIYYQTTAKDQGNLVLNLRDDANCYLRIASNGAFKSYFSPSDGNFHGNVNGKADTAGTADKANSVAWANVSGKPTIPAAAIAASGSNYVRFSDGTQLCWGTHTCGKKITQVTVTFPQSFLNTNYIFYAFSDFNIHNIDIYFKNKSTTKMLCSIDSNDTYYSSTDYSYFAIGRWK